MSTWQGKHVVVYMGQYTFERKCEHVITREYATYTNRTHVQSRNGCMHAPIVVFRLVSSFVGFNVAFSAASFSECSLAQEQA